MIKLEKKHIKIFSVVIATVFVGSVVAIALTQMGSLTGGTASAASSSVGVVDFRQVMSQSTELQDANTKMQLAVEEAKQEFDSKSAGMSEEEKANYYQQTQEKLAQKQQALFEPVQKKVEAEVKAVAEAKGLQVVIDKGAVVYGGQDITQDVIRKMVK
ncbi:MAG: OmpH family outer membrane protein [Schwartzia sp.]|nr:OmpH family outer membrane protein [Schwartzia sp. (in: firmicutes)]